jgi:hypothetical protein
MLEGRNRPIDGGDRCSKGFSGGRVERDDKRQRLIRRWRRRTEYSKYKVFVVGVLV